MSTAKYLPNQMGGCTHKIFKTHGAVIPDHPNVIIFGILEPFLEPSSEFNEPSLGVPKTGYMIPAGRGFLSSDSPSDTHWSRDKWQLHDSL